MRRILAARTPVRSGDESLRPASVLLALFAGSVPLAPTAAPHLWLVRRAEGMRVHGGQVALPGGQHDPDDRDGLATALREAHEEIGLAPSEVEVLGALDDCVTITRFAVTPYVGWIERPFEPAPLATEVARVFAAPLSAFEAPPKAMTVTWGSARRVVLSYAANDEIVWGATASILQHFVDLLRAS